VTWYKLKCDFCNEEFNVEDHPKQKFCSISCGKRARGKRLKDTNIFEKLNQNSSYILGLIWSDGNLYANYSNNYIREYLTIASTDYAEIEKVRKLITPKKKLYKEKSFGGGVVPIKQYKDKYMVKSCDTDIISSLKSYGLRPAKSKSLDWPQNLDISLISDFIRGYFDGDGCVYLSTPNKGSNTYLCIKFTCGTLSFLEKLKIILEDKDIDSRIVIDKRSNTPGLLITKQDSVLTFYKMIYDNSELFFKRKKDKFDNFYETK